jgi:tetratricopeptide (TPR) repeat protein
MRWPTTSGVVAGALVVTLGSLAPLASAQPAQPPQAAPPAAAPAQAAPPVAAPAQPAPAEQAPPAAAPAAEAAPADPAAQPTDADRERARALYTEGQRLYAAGEYARSREVFGQAYDAIPNPIVLLSIAECDAKLGDVAGAVTALKRYLAERPDAADRASVEARIAELEATPTVLYVRSSPSGAVIQLDGQDTGQVTPAEITVTPGQHQIEASLEGHDAASSTVDAVLGTRSDVDLVLPELPPPPPPPAPVGPPPPPPEPLPTTALWVTGAIGAAGIISGTVLGILALDRQSDYDANPNEATADDGERLALFADVSFGVAAMAIITGAVMWLTADDVSSSDDDAALLVRPQARKGTVGAAVRF